jgi:hypothetical protein
LDERFERARISAPDSQTEYLPGSRSAISAIAISIPVLFPISSGIAGASARASRHGCVSGAVSGSDTDLDPCSGQPLSTHILGSKRRIPTCRSAEGRGIRGEEEASGEASEKRR